jgi:predicted MFS family arabinose efflux permease
MASGTVTSLVVGACHHRVDGAAIIAAGPDGWRIAWYFFAGLTLVVGILTIVFQRDRPHSAAVKARPVRGSRSRLDLRSVVRSRYAWHLGFVYLMFGFAYMVYFTFFQKRLTADLGFSSSAAGQFFLVVGVVSLICGVLWGVVSDRIGRGRAIAAMCFLQAVAAVLFAWWPATPGLILSAIIFGLTSLAVPGIVGAGCGDQFGPVLASASLGFVTIFLGVGQVLGPYLAGSLADAHGTLTYSYLRGQCFAGSRPSAV